MPDPSEPRICKACGVAKPLDAFPFSAANLWRRHICSPCYSAEQGPKARARYEEKRDQILEQRRIRRAERKAAGLKDPPRRRQENERYKAMHKAASTKRDMALKVETFSAYGGAKCACCGESELMFLSLDHVDGGGNKHRQETGTRGGTKFYRALKAAGFPAGFQVLCMNCNCGRFRNGGICPHQKRHE